MNYCCGCEFGRVPVLLSTVPRAALLSFVFNLFYFFFIILSKLEVMKTTVDREALIFLAIVENNLMEALCEGKH